MVEAEGVGVDWGAAKTVDVRVRKEMTGIEMADFMMAEIGQNLEGGNRCCDLSSQLQISSRSLLCIGKTASRCMKMDMM